MDYYGASSKAARERLVAQFEKFSVLPCSPCLRGDPDYGSQFTTETPRTQRKTQTRTPSASGHRVLINWLGSIAHHLGSELNFGPVQANAAVRRYRSDS